MSWIRYLIPYQFLSISLYYFQILHSEAGFADFREKQGPSWPELPSGDNFENLRKRIEEEKRYDAMMDKQTDRPKQPVSDRLSLIRLKLISGFKRFRSSRSVRKFWRTISSFPAAISIATCRIFRLPSVVITSLPRALSDYQPVLSPHRRAQTCLLEGYW